MFEQKGLVTRTKRGQVLGSRGGFRGCTVWLTGETPQCILKRSLARVTNALNSHKYGKDVI